MKNTTSLLVFLIIIAGSALSLTAQENNQSELISNKNNIIGGSVFLTSDNNENNIFNTIIISPIISPNTVTERKNTAYNFSPYYLRKISQKLYLGITGTYGYNKFTTKGYLTPTLPFPNPVLPIEATLSSSVTNELNAWLFARYYIRPSTKLNFFLEPMIGIRTYKRDGFSSSTSGNTDFNQEINLFDVRINPGLSYKVANRINIIARLGSISYSSGTDKQETRSPAVELPFPLPTTTNSSSTFDVSDFTFNLRLSNIAFGAEFLF